MSPIERAAKALGEHYDGHADPVNTPVNWARAIDGVRAVLQAIREPSEEMNKAGRFAYDGDLDDIPGHGSYAGYGYVNDADAALIFRAMIGVILNARQA